MATKNWDNDFMSQLIDEQAWKGLSQDFQWSEQLLEKYADKVDWHEVSGNNQMLWTAVPAQCRYAGWLRAVLGLARSFGQFEPRTDLRTA